jgi:hypothetical protein
MLKRFRDGELLEQRYGYLDRPVREPILGEIHHGSDRVAALTRNGYGATVLNTVNLFIADVDVAVPAGLASFWQKVRRTPDVWLTTLDRIADVLAERSARIYRTFAGYRVFVVDRPIATGSAESVELLDVLDSDPLYRTLCTHQQCYRARLSPKPWRIGQPEPPRWLRDPTVQADHDRDGWLAAYRRRSEPYAVCTLVDAFGDVHEHLAAADLLALHDRHTLRPDAALA